MRLLSGIVASVTVIAYVKAFAQEPRLAREGRGLLPRPAVTPDAIAAALSPQSFVSDPSGAFSRTVFETDEDPNFKIVIQEISFPPDRQPHTITLPSAAIIHFVGGETPEVSISKQRWAPTREERRSVAAGAPIDVVNNGEYPVIVRALIVEAK